MKIRTIYIKNGDELTPYNIYSCECCRKDVEESHPKVKTADGIYCGDCAFKLGVIEEDEYIKGFLYFLPVERAAVHDGKIYLTYSKNSKFPWEKTNEQNRKSAEYINWRTAVFERDEYRCQICGRVGGKLNAHHIKPFAKYPKLRFDTDNGVTLCEACHRKVHKEKIREWIK